ncbi:MAG: TrpR-related protein YerC/YecD [Clostridia bacterium]|nr:TrpR-related protein YerC/YecD [Clostridia bacterium]
MTQHQEQRESVDELMRIIASLKDEAQCRAFFEDLCTAQELIQFAQRLQVAKGLLAGETYDAIRRRIPVSSATITRVNTALQFGTGGYRAVLSDRNGRD